METAASIDAWPVLACLYRMFDPEQTPACAREANTHDYWEPLLSLSSQHWITPQLYIQLRHNRAAWQLTPDYARSYLAQIYRLNQTRNRQLREQTIALLRALNRHAITPVVLKGSVQLLTANKDLIGQRLQTDIDILIEPSQLERASACLAAEGYRPAIVCDRQLIAANDNQLTALAQEFRHHHHLAPLVKLGQAASVELHRHPFARRFQGSHKLRDLLDRAQLKTVQDCRYFELAVADQADLIATQSFINDGHHCYYDLPLKLAWDWLSLVQSSRHRATGQHQLLLDGLVRELILGQTTTNCKTRRYVCLMRLKNRHPRLQPSYYYLGRCRYLAIKSYFYPNKVWDRVKRWFIHSPTIDRPTR